MPPDILILGGGPAGLSTALHLARLAPQLISRVLVLEKAHYPRHKLCAGALTADAEVILRGLGLDVTEVPHVDASAARLDFGGRGLRIALRGSHTLRMIRRDEFDAWLAAKVRLAGIEIREGVTARRVESESQSVIVHTDAGRLEAAIVVGADGSNGITRRCILPDAPIHTARALEVIIPASHVIARQRSERSNLLPSQLSSSELGDSAHSGYASGGLPDAYPLWDHSPRPRLRGRGRGHPTLSHAADIAYFDFAPVPEGIAGYTWDFPTQVDGRPARCWGIYDTNLLADGARPALKKPLLDEMQRHGVDPDGLEIQGHPIRWFSARSPLSAARVLLVVDAAGADGIFGEGIAMALGGGRLAAQAIRDAVKSDDFSFHDYDRRFSGSPLGQALTIRTGITHILYRLRWAWFQKFFWRVLKPVVGITSAIFVMNWARRMRYPGPGHWFLRSEEERMGG